MDYKEKIKIYLEKIVNLFDNLWDTVMAMGRDWIRFDFDYFVLFITIKNMITNFFIFFERILEILENICSDFSLILFFEYLLMNLPTEILLLLHLILHVFIILIGIVVVFIQLVYNLGIEIIACFWDDILYILIPILKYLGYLDQTKMFEYNFVICYNLHMKNSQVSPSVFLSSGLPLPTQISEFILGNQCCFKNRTHKYIFYCIHELSYFKETPLRQIDEHKYDLFSRCTFCGRVDDLDKIYFYWINKMDFRKYKVDDYSNINSTFLVYFMNDFLQGYNDDMLDQILESYKSKIPYSFFVILEHLNQIIKILSYFIRFIKI